MELNLNKTLKAEQHLKVKTDVFSLHISLLYLLVGLTSTKLEYEF